MPGLVESHDEGLRRNLAMLDHCRLGDIGWQRGILARKTHLDEDRSRTLVDEELSKTRLGVTPLGVRLDPLR